MELILKLLEIMLSFIGGFFYWVVLPILVYIIFKIFVLIFNISEAREKRDFCRSYGYRGKRRWWE